MSPFSSPASFLGGKDLNPKGLLIISSILGSLGFLWRYFHVAGQWRTEFREVSTCFSVSFLSTLKSAFMFVCFCFCSLRLTLKVGSLGVPTPFWYRCGRVLPAQWTWPSIEHSQRVEELAGG